MIPKLSGSVGYKGTNNLPDVILVQTMLMTHFCLSKKLQNKCGPILPTGKLDKFNPEDPTNKAIRMFQLYIMGWPVTKADGKVDPGGSTLGTLAGRIDAPIGNGDSDTKDDAAESWKAIVEADGILDQNRWISQKAREWILRPCVGVEAKFFEDYRDDSDGYIWWKCLRQGGSKMRPNKQIQPFKLYSSRWSWCLNKAEGNEQLASIYKHCNVTWNNAMRYYIIEKLVSPATARAQFREQEEAVARVMMGGIVGMFGAMGAGGGLPKCLDAFKNLYTVRVEKSLPQDKFLEQI